MRLLQVEKWPHLEETAKRLAAAGHRQEQDHRRNSHHPPNPPPTKRAPRTAQTATRAATAVNNGTLSRFQKPPRRYEAAPRTRPGGSDGSMLFPGSLESLPDPLAGSHLPLRLALGGFFPRNWKNLRMRNEPNAEKLPALLPTPADGLLLPTKKLHSPYPCRSASIRVRIAIFSGLPGAAIFSTRKAACAEASRDAIVQKLPKHAGRLDAKQGIARTGN